MGQIKRLETDVRLKLAHLVVALARDKGTPEDNIEIARRWRDCGYQTKKSNNETTADNARFSFDRFTEDVVDKCRDCEF